jgi:hypothetical protein
VKEKATKVDCLGWAGTKVSMFSSLGALAALYVLLKMREGVKEKATVKWGNIVTFFMFHEFFVQKT